MNCLIPLSLVVIVGCVSAQLFHVKRPHPWSHLSSKESAEKHGLANGGPFGKHQNEARPLNHASDLSVTTRSNSPTTAKPSGSEASGPAKLSALAQPEKHIVSSLSKSSGEIHSSKMQDDVQSISQHADDPQSKTESLIKPGGPAKPIAPPSGPAVPPSSSDLNTKSNGTSATGPAASSKHSSEESTEKKDSHSSEESAEKHRPSKSHGHDDKNSEKHRPSKSHGHGGHHGRNPGSSESDEKGPKSPPHKPGKPGQGADAEMARAILKQILKGEPVKVKVEKKSEIFFEREKGSGSSGSSSSSEEKGSHYGGKGPEPRGLPKY